MGAAPAFAFGSRPDKNGDGPSSKKVETRENAAVVNLRERGRGGSSTSESGGEAGHEIAQSGLYFSVVVYEYISIHENCDRSIA